MRLGRASSTRSTSAIPRRPGPPARASWCPGRSRSTGRSRRSSSRLLRQRSGSRLARARPESAQRAAHAGRARATFARCAAHRHGPGRLTLGRVNGRLVAAEPRQSAIVIGPTQTGKTTGFAIPAILEWPGPVVATSVKTDLLRETLAARSSLPRSEHLGIRPDRQHRPAEDAGWTPLMECLTWQGAQRVADWLVRAARPRQRRRARPPPSGTRATAEGARADPARSRLQRRIHGAGRRSGSTRQEDEPRAIRARGERRGRSRRRVRGDLDVGRTHPRKRLRDRPDRPHRLHRPRRSRLRHDRRAPRRAPPRRRPPHRLPLRSRTRAAPPPAAVRDARPGDRRARLRPQPPRPASRSIRRCCSSSTSAPTSHPCASSPRSRRPAPDRGSSSSPSSRTWRRSTPSTAATARPRSSPTTARR